MYNKSSEAECEIRKLREENEILRHTIHEWQHDCNKKREKLEAIREIADKYSVEYNHTIMVNPYQDFSLILNILNR